MAKRTLYSMHHTVATYTNMGKLCPFLIQEVAPGDSWSGSCSFLLRLSPLKHAILNDLYIDGFLFYVPHRLVWSDFPDFIADGPMDTPNHSVPTISVPGGSASYVPMFMRANAGATATLYSALRLRAYNLVWNEYFRDESEAVITPDQSPGGQGQTVNMRKEYWTTLRDNIGHAQNIHYFDTNVGSGTQASALDVLTAVARQKIAIKRETYGSRYIDILRS